MNVLVLGGGYIGNHLFNHLKGSHNVEQIVQRRVDYTHTNLHSTAQDFKSYLHDKRFDIAVNCSGYTGKPNVDEAEQFSSGVMSLFPKEIQEEFTQNTKIFEMENEYEGNVFTSVVSQLDTFYDKDENGVNILSDNGSLIISQAGREKLNQMTNGLDPTHEAAIIKYVEESVIGENSEITNDSYAIEYIDNQVANKLDPRQELNHYFLNDMITKTTYRTYKDNYNKRSTGDRQDQDLLDAVEIPEAPVVLTVFA